MIDGIYGVICDVSHRRYSIVWKERWYNYTIDYAHKATTFRCEPAHHSKIKYNELPMKTIIINGVIPLNEENFLKTIERFEKLLLLQ